MAVQATVEIDFTTNLSTGLDYGEQAAHSGPYTYHRLKETSGTFADASGNARTGTGAGTVTYNQTTTPVTGDLTARNVNFTTDTTGISFTGTTPTVNKFSIEAFVYVTSLGVKRVVFENDGSTLSKTLLDVVINTDGSIAARATDGAATLTTSAGQITTNTWYHLVVIFDAPGRTVTFYKNAALVSSHTWQNARTSAPSLAKVQLTWRWGTDTTASSTQGSIARLAEPATYLRALSPTEISDHYGALATTTFAGYTWSDVTEYVDESAGIMRRFGRDSNLTDVNPMELALTLRNPDRRFEPGYGTAGTLTVAGGVINDAYRAAGTQGDGLLNDSSYGIWRAATNLVTNGGFETNTTGWTAVGSTLSRVTTQLKFGAAAGQVVTNNAAANEGGYHNFTATAAVYTVSAWVRGTGGTVRMAVRDNAGASPQTGTAVTLTTAWQRVSLTTTSLSAATWRCYVETNVQQNITYHVDGVQAELSGSTLNYPTPYIHTDGSTAARTEGEVQAPASVIDETQAWVAMRIRSGSSAIPNRLFQWYDDANNRILVTAFSGAVHLRHYPASGSPDTVNQSLSLTTGQVYTVTAAWTATQLKISVDGAAFTAATRALGIPALSATTWYMLNGSGGTAPAADSDVLWCAAGTGTLTDADAATIHSYGNTDPGAVLPGNQTFYWSADTAGWSIGSPYAGYIKPGRPIRVRMTESAVTYDWAFGFIDDWPQEYPDGALTGYVPIVARCKLARMLGDDLGARDFVEQAAGARLNALLNVIGHAVSARAIDTGVHTIMAQTVDKASSGVHAKQVARTDRGLFHFDGRGYAVYQDGDYRTTETRATVSNGTLGHDNIAYRAPVFHSPASLIRNVITVRRPGGVDQTARDGPSVKEYGESPYNDELLLTTDAAALTRAAALLAENKDPRLRVQSITYNPAASSAWAHALGVKLSDRYTWVWAPPVGASASRAVWVEGVQDYYSGDEYLATWFLTVVP